MVDQLPSMLEASIQFSPYFPPENGGEGRIK